MFQNLLSAITTTFLSHVHFLTIRTSFKENACISHHNIVSKMFLSLEVARGRFPLWKPSFVMRESCIDLKCLRISIHYKFSVACHNSFEQDSDPCAAGVSLRSVFHLTLHFCVWYRSSEIVNLVSCLWIVSSLYALLTLKH
jgi:hypothetical protein